MEHNTELTSSAYLKVRGVDDPNGGGISARSNGSAGDVTRAYNAIQEPGDETNRIYD
jgi:hypothetical protein